MERIHILLQIVVGLGLLNVWLLRRSKQTAYRGKGAPNLRAEFQAYGLPVWAMWATGACKITIAIALIAGIWMPALVQPAALVLIVLMLGALAMHLKVKDPIKASLPALAMLIMAAMLALPLALP